MAAPTGLVMCSALSGARNLFGLSAFLRPMPVLGLVLSRNAARKGTREKARKKKVKIEVQKVGFIPHNLRASAKNKLALVSKKMDDRYRGLPIDDVWPAKYYQWRAFSFDEAVECHRETHHPTIYNVPNAPITATIDLDLRTHREDKFLEKFSCMVPLPHGFFHGQIRSILALSKDIDQQKAALEKGAQVAGGLELIKDIQSGEVNLQDFQHIVADTEILQDLTQVRGLMKRKFPNPNHGTLGTDVALLAKNFRDGVQFALNVQEHEKDFGWVDQQIGTLDMATHQLRENLVEILKAIQKYKPPRIEHQFIWRVSLKSAPSVERIKIKHEALMQVSDNTADQSDSDEEPEKEKEEAAL